MLKRLILKLRHVKEFKIEGFFSKVVSRLEAKGFIFPSNIKFPDVTSDPCGWWYTIPSRQLETWICPTNIIKDNEFKMRKRQKERK
ncbi:hypothetical protein L2E82_39916 [Cichorium intybus]|uniref:Uncharacterized protein n=1 Tax=Cichorium intybus TaxID=13427 RepID=A0ACB9AJV3_CICIN|nr:hypothetical protein L2E82_39916 [Cichorium intybus]